MKRLIALLVGLTVLLSMSLTSFAAFSDEIALNDDGITYTAALSDEAATANAGKQTTIVAYKGDVIEVGSIQYIDQAAATSFTFQLMDELTENVKVVMGGEAIDKQEIGTIFFETEPVVENVALSGTIEGYYADTAELPVIEIANDDNSYEATIVDGEWEVEGGVVPGTYTVYASKAYHTYHSIAALEVTEDTADVALYVYAGDLDESTWIDSDDVMFILDYYDYDDTYDEWADCGYMDIDESTWIDSDDVMFILDCYDFESIEE